jgi:hypothetical protein
MKNTKHTGGNVMEKVEIEKDNWTADKTFVCYSEKKNTFIVECIKENFELRKFSEDGYVIKGSEHGEFNIGTVCFDKMTNNWIAFDNNSITREHDNRFVASAQLLCNIL